MTDHLVIGDPHAGPDISNERFDWLGNLILHRRPDVVVCMGDFADMPSLSSYDRGKKSFEGRRFNNDVAAVHDALRRINEPVRRHNAAKAKNRKSQYRPRMIMLGGNHDEARIDRTVQLHPELDGTISVDQLNYVRMGWEYVPYAQPILVDGVWYSHHFPSGVKGEPISGANICQSLLSKVMESCSVGHNHLFDYAVRSTPSGVKLHALSAGCYFEHKMDYAKSTEYMWWRGLCYKHNVTAGEYDLETIHMSRIRAMQGKL